MIIEVASIIAAAIGGTLIGIAAVAMMALNGRVLGVSGLAAGLLAPRSYGRLARAYFVAGLVGGGAVIALTMPEAMPGAPTGNRAVLLLAGLAVGFGTRLGGGCTSGHGVCGMARLSRRSIAATLIFMAVAIVTVFVARHIGGSA